MKTMLRSLLIILFLLPPAYLGYLIYMYIRTHVPYVVTPRKRLPFIMEHMRITADTIIYDLGCGKGDILFTAEKFKPKKLIGFELSPLHAWYAQGKAWCLNSRVRVYRRDFFTADISEADIIYLFLVQSIVEKIWVKIQREAKPGTKVIILSNVIPELEGKYVEMRQKGVAIAGGLYIYTIQQKNQSSD